MALVRPQDGLFLVLPIVDAAVAGWRRARLRGVAECMPRFGAMVAVALVVFSPQLVAWRVLNGDFLRSGYEQQLAVLFDWTSPRLLAVLLSTRRGLFVWHPVFLPATIGLLVLWRQRPRAGRHLRTGVDVAVVPRQRLVRLGPGRFVRRAHVHCLRAHFRPGVGRGDGVGITARSVALARSRRVRPGAAQSGECRPLSARSGVTVGVRRGDRPPCRACGRLGRGRRSFCRRWPHSRGALFRLVPTDTVVTSFPNRSSYRMRARLNLSFAIVLITAALVAGVAGTAISASGGPSADDTAWSRFRGPNGRGVVEATNLPAEVGPDRNVIWKTDLPPGHSSPILSDDKIFLTAVDGTDLFTIALDRATGEELWPPSSAGRPDGSAGLAQQPGVAVAGHRWRPRRGVLRRLRHDRARRRRRLRALDTAAGALRQRLRHGRFAGVLRRHGDSRGRSNR